MEIMSFEIEGKFAHFRKYFANNTAFTFALPPRTTIMGMIAAAMGWQKDSYYEDLHSENLKIGVFIVNPVKKSFHRLNLLMIKNDSDFRGRLKHVQTPFEIVSGINPKKDFVKYRIYLAPGNSSSQVYDKIKATFQNLNFRYNLTLGTANFSATIYKVTFWDNVEKKHIDNEAVTLYSTGISGNVSEISFEKTNEYRFNMIEEELMPADFKSNYDREVIKMNRILFTTGGTPLKVKLTGDVYVLKDNNTKQTIQFLEE